MWQGKVIEYWTEKEMSGIVAANLLTSQVITFKLFQMFRRKNTSCRVSRKWLAKFFFHDEKAIIPLDSLHFYSTSNCQPLNSTENASKFELILFS